MYAGFLVQIRAAVMEGWLAAAMVERVVGAVVVLWIRTSVVAGGSCPALVTMGFAAVVELRKGAMVPERIVVTVKSVGGDL